MIRRWPAPRYVSEARAAVGPARLRAFTRRCFRKRARVCTVCPGRGHLQVAHLVAVAEDRALALREKNTVTLCLNCHRAFDALVGVLPPGSRLYTDPAPRVARYRAAFDALLARRALLRRAYAPR